MSERIHRSSRAARRGGHRARRRGGSRDGSRGGIRDGSRDGIRDGHRDGIRAAHRAGALAGLLALACVAPPVVAQEARMAAARDTTPESATPATSARDAAGPSTEERIEALERKLEALLAELERIRGEEASETGERAGRRGGGGTPPAAAHAAAPGTAPVAAPTLATPPAASRLAASGGPVAPAGAEASAGPGPGTAPGADGTGGSGRADGAEGDPLPPLTFQAGDFTLDVGGYGSFRYDASDADAAENSLTLRRFVVTTDARVGDRLQVYSEIEYERLSEIEIERGVSREAGGLEFEQELEGTNESEIAVEQAWGQFNLAPEFGIRFGAVLPPVGRFNLFHDDNLWNFARRPLSVRGANVLPATAAWTEMGLGFVGEANVGEGILLSYQAYLLNGVELDFAIEEKVQTRVPKRNKLLLEAAVSPTAGSFDGKNTADAVAGRFAVSPALGSEFAVSGYAGEYTPGFMDGSETLTTLGLDGKQKIGPVELEGEFLWTHYAGLDRVLNEFARVAVDQATETESSETATLESEIEIELSGLSEDRFGFWVDAGVPLALRRGFLGLENPVLIPVVRYERVWFDQNLEEFGFSGGTVTELLKGDREQDRLSLGFAFRPVPQTVFHLLYERNDALEGSLLDPQSSEGDTNGFTFGMAVGF